MAADGVRVFPAVELKVGPEAADGERVSPAADLKVDPETEYMVTDGDRVSPAADLKAVPEMGDMATDGKRVTPTADPKALVVPSTKMSAETQESIRLGLASSLAGEALDYFLGEGVFFRDDPSFSNSLPGDDMERIELVHEALLAIQANRHKDAIACINHVAMLGRRLSCSERALFAVSTVRATLDAKKSVDLLMSRGSSINTTTELEAGMLAEYSSRVRLEFQNTCLSQIGVIEKLLLPTSTGESLVSYLRIKGLVLEVLARADSTSLNRYWALSSYMAAFEKAEQQLCPSNMERLYAALDLTLFLEGAMNDLESAYVISRKALHEANSELQLRGPRDPDISESVRLFKQLGSRVTELSILVTGYQDLVPDKDYWKVRSKTSSPEYRNCKSDDEGKWMVKLPQNLLCPEVEPYELERYEDEEDYLHSRLVAGFSGGV